MNSMKTLYVCGVCGEIYENEFDAQYCEQAHIQPKGVLSAVYPKHEMYPSKVEIAFGNITAIYTYESGLPVIGTSTRDKRNANT